MTPSGHVTAEEEEESGHVEGEEITAEERNESQREVKCFETTANRTSRDAPPGELPAYDSVHSGYATRGPGDDGTNYFSIRSSRGCRLAGRRRRVTDN
ncbi:hypothetical protein EYF80_050591 [Liparis tanakae]|uniref:Uncharacterized protein n=1 Tax=Liparis tanakae TaxID=230148 RepID=A0A4Z2FEM9_9TELE|nr:hypothetical protein EYF80_050591 [Liparis tanakae]